MPEYGKETSNTASHNEGENKAIRRENDANWCWHFFGSHKDQFSFTIKSGTTVNRACYSAMLWDWKRWAIWTKCPELWPWALYVSTTIPIYTLPIHWQLNSKVLEHPLHNPDLTPSDYHMFGPLRDTVGWCHSLTAMYKWHKLCMNGLSANQKHFLLWGHT